MGERDEKGMGRDDSLRSLSSKEERMRNRIRRADSFESLSPVAGGEGRSSS
jgi:hypothetical protein